MTKVVVSIQNPGASPADNGRTVHALKLARGLQAGGAELVLHFCGEGVKWIPRFVNRGDESHPFVKAYGPVFDEVRESVRACNMCCKRFDQTDAVEAAGVPVLGEGKEHSDAAAWMLDGYQMVNY